MCPWLFWAIALPKILCIKPELDTDQENSAYEVLLRSQQC